VVEMVLCNPKMPSFVKFYAAFQAVLKFSLRNLKGCNIYITNGPDLFIRLLKFSYVP
jgi:hypothetical protein